MTIPDCVRAVPFVGMCACTFCFLKLYRIGEELSSYFWKDASTISN